MSYVGVFGCLPPALCGLPPHRPVDGAAAALRGLAKTHKFVVVTSRQLAIEEATRAWLKKHFDGVFDQVLLANHYAKEGSGPVK